MTRLTVRFSEIRVYFSYGRKQYYPLSQIAFYDGDVPNA